MDITKELEAMARGISGVANESDQHSEVKLLREAVRLLNEADRFIEGYAASAESGFARRAMAHKWRSALRHSIVLENAHAQRVEEDS